MRFKFPYLIACFLLVLLPFQVIASVMVLPCSGKQMHCQLMSGKQHCCCLGGCVAAIKKNLKQRAGDHQFSQAGEDQSIYSSSLHDKNQAQQSAGCDMQFICAATFPFLSFPATNWALPTHLQEMLGSSASNSYNSFIPDGLQRPPQISVHSFLS
jgi:hypothetical protein